MRQSGKYKITEAIAEQAPKPFSILIFLGLVVYLPPSWSHMPADFCQN